MVCAHSDADAVFVETGWLWHVFCASCGNYLTTELDEEIYNVARYKRSTLNDRLLEVDGELRTLREWSNVGAAEPALIHFRMERWGWTPRRAVFTPTQTNYGRKRER